MEPKNMNGFCELTREDAKEIDGGYDRLAGITID